MADDAVDGGAEDRAKDGAKDRVKAGTDGLISMAAEISVSCIVLGPDDGGCLLREPMGLRLHNGVTIAQALSRFTGLGDADVAGLFAARRVAVFGVTARADDVLHEGDRIEVLDDLHFDPMESRRRRARHKAEQPKSRRRQQVKTGG